MSKKGFPGSRTGLEAGSEGDSVKDNAIVAGCDLAAAGIGKILVAWWLGMEVASRKFVLSLGKDLRGMASLSMTWRYGRDTCWGPIGAPSWPVLGPGAL
ncbi:hypothetical protein RHMOL_Rhmol13G0175500 [Rhododendron molle]|uniref:Uncharacterized protein n=1 Tax=Rhododendron molle TaxID=49168 RepID=A0ACC0L8W3_RHOML|nr:hypothetical protein RHMOL_Rhmol13G0175500 [Rhododendron molle]